jgi:outer membrane protein OmpA-like peptidoglycan-associated protein
VVIASVLVTALVFSPLAFGDDDIRGVITGRGNDGSLIVRADDSSTLTVMLSETTKIKRTDGSRVNDAEASVLIPGLRVKVKGLYDGENRFTAEEVTFTRDDLKMALAIYGGVEATDKRSVENRQRIEQNTGAIQQHSQELRAEEEKIVATTGSLAATNARISNLDNYDVVSTMTVHFRNGEATIDSKYREQLQQFAAQAANTPGYMIQVEGFASAVGPYTLNQRLSFERATGVAAVLQQSGIPPTKMFPPAPMGVSVQVADNRTAKGQAENRRTVVSLLRNKGLADQPQGTTGQ